MQRNTIVTAVVMDETTTISWLEVCETCDISEDVLADILESGLFHHDETNVKNIAFDLKMLSKIQTARRLQRDLGINLPGVVVVMDLLEELEELRDEVRMLQRHIKQLG